MWRAALALVFLLSLFGCGGDDAGTSAPSARVRQWELFEVKLERAVVEANPFDPHEIAVWGDFRAPSGAQITVPGFASRDYTRALIDGREALTPNGELAWKLRFTPSEEGRWSWRSRIETAAGSEMSEWQPLEVDPPADDAHGFLRRSPKDERYLAFDDGTSYFAIGENMAWYDERGTYAYDVWSERLADAGGNFIRLWMPSWAFGLEWIRRGEGGAVESSSLGDYGDRLERAWQLDYVIDQARRHGLQVMLSIQNHGAFSLTNNSEWVDSPYNAANGGPLLRPRDFFTDGEARALFKRRLRYIVARWGYAPNLLAWELWNEVGLVDFADVASVVAWHREMAAELRALDPWQHLITTSTAGDDTYLGTFRALWADAAIDFAQAHVYGVGALQLDFSGVLNAVAAPLRAHHKPVLIGEAGVDFRGPAETLSADPEGDGLHDIVWAGAFAQTFGCGMTWWWDNVIDPENLYRVWPPLARFVEGIDFASEGFVAASTTPMHAGRRMRVQTLSGERVALAWVKDLGHQWYAPDPQVIDGLVLEVDVASGAWTATVLDTRSGEVVATAEHLSSAPLRLELPPFEKDVAVRFERE